MGILLVLLLFFFRIPGSSSIQKIKLSGSNGGAGAAMAIGDFGLDSIADAAADAAESYGYESVADGIRGANNLKNGAKIFFVQISFGSL